MNVSDIPKIPWPWWFFLQPGATFFDHDGNFCVLLGWEPEYEQIDLAGEINLYCSKDMLTINTHQYFPQFSYMCWHNNSWIHKYISEDTFDKMKMWTSTGDEAGQLIKKNLMSGNTHKKMRKESP